MLSGLFCRLLSTDLLDLLVRLALEFLIDSDSLRVLKFLDFDWSLTDCSVGFFECSISNIFLLILDVVSIVFPACGIFGSIFLRMPSRLALRLGSKT